MKPGNPWYQGLLARWPPSFNFASVKNPRRALAFSDKGDVAPYAMEAVETFVNLQAISGMGDGTFAPRKSISRAEAASILTNLFF